MDKQKMKKPQMDIKEKRRLKREKSEQNSVLSLGRKKRKSKG
ncbi:hypothetical protein ACFOE0_13375 [Shewanella submarina]|uniref:Uncharacterized protein n=1 Tax=Shewanella submarina TaxID=2016376 RepID=A0ABV7GCK2_9GAMM|nr:hypothetical protein [Shewanella submarina]